MTRPIFLGWHAPAIELVADFLTTRLSERELARATVVVPTAESRRALKECMAERLQRPVLMPRIVQPGNLMEMPAGSHDATETDTRAAWLKVMSRVAEEVMAEETGPWFDLFPKAPVGNPAPWVANMAERLLRLRAQMEQECLTDAYAELLQGYAPDFAAKRADAWQQFVRRMGARWNAVQRLFRMADEELHRQGLRTAEEVTAEAAHRPCLLRPDSLLVLACVPEISPLNELFIRKATESGQRRLCVLVNAPQEEAPFFDALGRPLVRDAAGQRVSRWLDDAIPLHNDAEGRPAVSDGKRVILQAADAEDMGAKAVALAAGKSSQEVTIAVCDNGMAPAVHAAFLRAEGSPWCLNLPAGRSAAATQEGALATLLAAALQVPHRLPLYNDRTGHVENDEPNLLEPLRALLGNEVLQRCFTFSPAATGERADLNGFAAALDEVFRTAYPSHMQDLVRCFSPRDPEAPEPPARRYVRYVCRLVQAGSGAPEEMATALRDLSRLLSTALRDSGGSLLAEPLRKLAGFLSLRGGEYAPSVLHLLLRRTLEDAAKQKLPFLHREETHGDIVGWNELTYCRGSHLILCGMHDDCVPARPLSDIFLPDALRCSVGITSSESRTARDAFLLTALLHGHPNRVTFLVARSRTDGAPPAPSSLLLRCGQNREELAARAAYLFREPEEVARRKEYIHWNLLHAPVAGDTTSGRLSDLRRADGSVTVNPFAPENSAAPAFSPSLLNTFLRCPLRFWLQYACGLSPSDAYPEDLSELQGNQYGDLMHEVLRRFTEHYDAADKLPEGDETAQLDVLRADIDRLTEQCYRRYGDTSRALLLVQKEQMKASLHDFARCHRADLLAGWRVMWREEKVTPTLIAEDGSAVPFTMRLDRVDRHDETGQWRIIDYKSNDKLPEATHYASLGSDEPPYLTQTELAPCVFSEKHLLADGGSRLRFFRITNVQLPLYATALRQLCAEKGESYLFPLLGYYNIPRGKAEAGFTPLFTKEKPKHVLTEAYEEIFLACVRRLVTLIRAGECLRSAESLGFTGSVSSFGALTPDDDPRSLCGMKAEFNP